MQCKVFEVKNKAYSRTLQEVLISLGYRWYDTKGFYDTPLKYIHINYDENYQMTHSNTTELKISTIDSLFDIKETKFKLDTLDHEVKLSENMVVGCQTLSKKDSITLAEKILEHFKKEK